MRRYSINRLTDETRMTWMRGDKVWFFTLAGAVRCGMSLRGSHFWGFAVWRKGKLILRTQFNPVLTEGDNER